jgi:Flp pilus assembly protein TadD
MKREFVCAMLLSCLVFAQTDRSAQLFQTAVDAQQRGDFTLAVRTYRQVLQIEPNLVEARANLGAALVHLGRFDEAITEYRIAWKAAPNDSAIRLNLALAYYKKGDVQQAAPELESVRESRPNDLRVATLLGDCYLRRGEYDRAVAMLAPSEAVHPEDLDLAFVLGSALLHTGKMGRGVALLERVGKQGRSADAYFLAGSRLLQANENARALDDLQSAARLNPMITGLYTALGIAKEGTGDNEGAEKDLRRALELDRNDFDANIHLGGILYTRRDLDGARPFIARALSIRPDSLFALYEMALLKSAAGDLENAAKDLEKVVNAGPNWLEPHVQLAALYYKLHRPADGLREKQVVERLTAEQSRQGPPANEKK